MAVAVFALASLVEHAAQPARMMSEMISELCGDGPETPFMAENQAAMQRMMSGMNITRSGDVDRDFAAMMIPHHQGAIEMAQAELRHGHNEQLRRIAQEIIVEQQQEIAAMRLALGQELPPSSAAPNQAKDLKLSAVTSGALPHGRGDYGSLEGGR
ncbi:DUF305 domain-containing protein [Bradyrhizobium rifense]|uniref:DUF305 domain-containing protein n=2 Tax=Nitrobacteraceae TaxID=41294 RepID=A0A5D3KHV7_9BRAD|nr:DUF305 domain-containing protein [Bradyrhizobium rifense]